MKRTLTLNMSAVPKARHRTAITRAGTMRTYPDPKTATFEETVGWTWREKYGPLRADTWPEHAGLYLALCFWIFRPWGTPKARLLPSVKPDLDNLVKSILDGLQGVAYVDDSRITRLAVVKRYTRATPAIEITLLEDEPDERGELLP